MKFRIAIFHGGLGLLIASFSTALFAQDINFNQQIRPLLSSRCFACHGPDSHSREAGLRLDKPDGDEGAIGFVIEPGSVEDSEMWERITTDDESSIMPPPESNLKPLNADEQQLIKLWIESGASYENFWAFIPPAEPPAPEVKNSNWSQRPIDLFVLRKLESAGLQPSEMADPRTLIRRVTFDLTGLPPTRTEILEFLSAYQQAPEAAWESLVDRLLERPQYGEQMARYWLDLVRFADTNGMHKDFYRNQVPYRDWVIRAFNENLGYDDFVRFQLAGDLYPQPTNDQLIASGFNRLHLIIDAGTALPEESDFKNGVDRVTAVGTAFMGLTVHCAQCHDHKFDPVTQKDFYSLVAFFNNDESAPETSGGPRFGLQPPFVNLGSPAQQAGLEKMNVQVATLKAKVDAANEAMKTETTKVETEVEVKKTEAVEETRKAKAEDEAKKARHIERLNKRLKSLEKKRDELEQEIPQAMVMKERPDVRETFVAIRGQYDAPGDSVQRNTPGFLPPLKKSGEIATRMDLAEWFVEPENPLTARVAVNRFWQQFFGVGLIKTSEDLGSQGEVPSHPELLDHLSVAFMNSGWDVKALVKRIVMSKTYRQDSTTSTEQFQRYPENRLLARGPRYRLDAEMIRDQMLATSGLLTSTMFGPSVKPPQPPGLWEAVSMIGEVYHADSGESVHRRSLYTFWKRAMPPPQMTILNAPIRDACIARRERTNTPSQALLLLNEEQCLEAADHLAHLTLEQPASDRIAFAWETVTSHLPDPQETKIIEKLLGDLLKKYQDDPKLAGALCRAHGLKSDVTAERAAWTVVANTLYNLDITKTKN